MKLKLTILLFLAYTQIEGQTFNVGDQWIYEEEYYFGGGNTELSFKAYIIQDVLIVGMYDNYVLEVLDTFYVENNKMHFWDEYYQEYIMYFDFDAPTSYEIKYYDQFRENEEIATVVIDSIKYMHFGQDSLKVQHVHILNSGTLENYHDVVYQGIGAGHYGIKFLLGCGLCDNNPINTKLRCFTNESMTYQFVPYACDSTWISTSLSEIIKSDISIFPNPTNGHLLVKGLDHDVNYELYTIHGILVDKGKTQGNAIHLRHNGVHYLKLKVNDVWITRKIVRTE